MSSATQGARTLEEVVKEGPREDVIRRRGTWGKGEESATAVGQGRPKRRMTLVLGISERGTSRGGWVGSANLPVRGGETGEVRWRPRLRRRDKERRDPRAERPEPVVWGRREPSWE